MYIQSFYQYPVTYSSIGKALPAKNADGETKNIIEVTDAELHALEQKEPLFRALVNQKKYRVLKKLPESYKAAAQQINEARDAQAEAEARAQAAEAELAALKAQMGAGNPAEEEAADLSKMDYKALQALAKEKGIENVNIKKADLIKAIKDAE